MGIRLGELSVGWMGKVRLGLREADGIIFPACFARMRSGGYVAFHLYFYCSMLLETEDEYLSSQISGIIRI